MFNRLFSRIAHPVCLKAIAKQHSVSRALFSSPKCFKTYLTHHQPFQPQSKGYLELQKKALIESAKAIDGDMTIVRLEKGLELIGLTSNLDTIYGGVPLYPRNTVLTKEELNEIRETINKLGSKWMIYEVNESIDCIEYTCTNGDKRYFVHDYFLNEKKENTNTLTP